MTEAPKPCVRGEGWRAVAIFRGGKKGLRECG